jgi:hypothetical protein
MSNPCPQIFNLLTLSRKKNVDYYVKSVASGKPAVFAAFAEGVVQMAQYAAWHTDGQGMLTKDIFKDVDTLSKHLTGASLSDFLRYADDKDVESKMQKLHGYVQTYSAMITEPDKVLQNKDISDIARGSLEHFVEYNNKAMRNKFEKTLNPFRFVMNTFFAPNMVFSHGDKTLAHYMTNIAAAYRMHDPSNSMLVKVESIQNSTAKMSSEGLTYLGKVAKSSETNNVKEYLIDGLLPYMDPSQSASDEFKTGSPRVVIDKAIRNKISNVMHARFQDELGLHADKEAFIDEVFSTLKVAQGKVNKFWYGVTEPAFRGPNGEYKPITPKEILAIKGNIDYGDGNMGDSFLRNYMVNNIMLHRLLKNLPALPDAFKTYVKKWDDPENINIRINYMPLSSVKDIDNLDIFKLFGIDHDKGFNIEFSHSMARTKPAETDDSVNRSFIMDINNYMKDYRFSHNKKAAYALARNVYQYMVDDETLKISNNNAYAMLLHRSKKDLDRLENPKGKKLPLLLEGYKNFLQMIGGLAIACRITGSPLTNLAAAGMNSVIKQDVMTQIQRKKDFNTALKGKGIDSDIAEFIDHDSKNYFVMDKITSVLTKEAIDNQKIMQQQALDELPSILHRVPVKLMNVLTKGGNIAIDRLMNQFLGILPRSWTITSMEGSEGLLMRQAVAEAFFDSQSFGHMYAKSRGMDMENLTPEQHTEVLKAMKNNYRDHKTYYYNTIKQMYGAYTANHKATYAGDFMKDASSMKAITLGQILVMHSAFKQISVNNADMIARASSIDLRRVVSESSHESPVNLSGVGGVFLLGLYNQLMEYAAENKYGVRMPNIGLLSNVDIFEDADRKYKMLAYSIKSALNMPTTQKEIQDAAQYWKFLLGVGVGGGIGRFSSDVNQQGEYDTAVKDYEGMMDLIKEYVTNNYTSKEGMLSFLPLYGQMGAWKRAMVAEDLTPNQRRAIINTGLDRGQFYADRGNKILRTFTDVSIIAREMYETYGKERDGQDISKFREYVLATLNRTAQTNFYMPQVPYSTPDYWKTWGDYRITNLTRVDYLAKSYDNKDYSKSRMYKQQSYDIQKAFRSAMGQLKPPSWELRKVKSQVDYRMSQW